MTISADMPKVYAVFQDGNRTRALKVADRIEDIEYENTNSVVCAQRLSDSSSEGWVIIVASNDKEAIRRAGGEDQMQQRAAWPLNNHRAEQQASWPEKISDQSWPPEYLRIPIRPDDPASCKAGVRIPGKKSQP